MAEQSVVHEPRCNTVCAPGVHHLASGIGFPHLHRTDLGSECGECLRGSSWTSNRAALPGDPS